jgi:hypothetical protein
MSLVIGLAGCTGSGTTRDAVDTEQRISDYQEFLNSTPSFQEQSVGNPAADLLFTGIQGLAVQQHQAFQLYAENMDGPVKPLAMRLEAIASEGGEDAYIAAVQELSPEDLTLYRGYHEKQRALTATRILMIPEALRIVQGLSTLNPRDLASNPMAIASAGNAVRVAVAQGQYVTKSLEYMRLMNERLEAAAQYMGR